MPFNPAEIAQAVENYNQNPNNILADNALHANLNNQNTLIRVCLIADWGSIPIRGFPFVERIAMAEYLDAHQHIFAPIQNFAVDMMGDPNPLFEFVDELPVELLTAGGVNPSRQLSFLTKYFHHCINPTFPIWDSRACGAVANNYPGFGIAAHLDRTWQAYFVWCQMIHGLLGDFQDVLQDNALGGGHIIRKLDKALYTIGA